MPTNLIPFPRKQKAPGVRVGADDFGLAITAWLRSGNGMIQAIKALDIDDAVKFEILNCAKDATSKILKLYVAEFLDEPASGPDRERIGRAIAALERSEG